MVVDELHLDLETYCELPLTGKYAVGAFRYAQHPSFEILMLAYKWNDGEEYCVDIAAGEEIPEDVWLALEDPTVIKYAHNAPFEMACFQFGCGVDIDPSQWRDTMIMAAYLGLPLALEKVAKVLRLADQKDARGKRLIKLFCEPVAKPKKKDAFRVRNLWHHLPVDWEEFKDYNVQDVRVEYAIHKYCQKYAPVPAIEWEYWALDQRINMAGVTIDVSFVRAAIQSNNEFQRRTHDEIIELTGIANPNSLDQLKAWLLSQGFTIPSLTKEFFMDVDLTQFPANVARLFELRQLASKASISKYGCMLRYLCADGRNHGLFQFYGANRTGREAGRGVQPQNLKKTFSNAEDIEAVAREMGVRFEDVLDIVGDALETAKEAIRKGLADVLYTDVPDLISKLVRTAIIPERGNLFAVCDFSAIEARVVAWLAGEDWVLDVFKTHGKIYEATAANMFNVPFDSVTKGSAMRSKGKVATLALGYQGAVGAMLTMGALREGILEDEIPALVRAWRRANPNIVKLWAKVESAVKHVLERKSRYTLRLKYTQITFSYERGYLFIELPSGRRLSYYGASLRGRNKITYYGLNDKGQWVLTDSYGGKLVENITQAIARDCLFDSMYRLKDLDLRMHVHDEIVAETLAEEADEVLEVMEQVMAVSPLWCSDLPLRGDGFVTKFYKKD